MKHYVVQAASALLAASLAGPALAGDAANFNPLGFSEDGRYFAFEEFGIQDGDPRYEFEILTADGRETEVECSASTGKIVEVEWENEHMDLDAFLANAKVSPGEARKTALRAIPGRIVGMDLETTSTGQMSYEFEVRTDDGKNMDIEVDAMTGKVTETEIEIYQLGDAFD